MTWQVRWPPVCPECGAAVIGTYVEIQPFDIGLDDSTLIMRRSIAGPQYPRLDPCGHPNPRMLGHANEDGKT